MGHTPTVSSAEEYEADRATETGPAVTERTFWQSHYLDSWWPPSSSILQVLAWVSTIRVYKRIPKTSETYKDSIGYWSAELWFLWNYSKVSWLKLSYYGNLISKISSFSSHSHPWAINTSVPKYNKKPRQRNTARDSGCPQITHNTDQQHIQNNRWSLGQLLKLVPFTHSRKPTEV